MYNANRFSCMACVCVLLLPLCIPTDDVQAQCVPLYTFDGEMAGDNFGYSVSGAGDVDNDGYADLIVGAWFNDAGGSDAGRAYVYSGQSGALLYTFTGEAAGDRFGESVSGAGDVDNDGYADVVVGAPGNDGGGNGAGRVYVYSGQTGVLLWTFTGWVAPSGLPSYEFGCSVSGAGDVDNDGYADLIVGAPLYIANGTRGGRLYTRARPVYGCGHSPGRYQATVSAGQFPVPVMSTRTAMPT